MSNEFDIDYFEELNKDIKEMVSGVKSTKDSSKMDNALTELLNSGVFELEKREEFQEEERLVIDILDDEEESSQQDLSEYYDEEEDNFDISTELLEESFNKVDYEDLDTNREIPNIPTTELEEYILIKGHYSPMFKEFILDEKMIESGELALAIDYEGNAIVFKMINPTPKNLYKLKSTLIGFEFKHFSNGEFKDLDIMSFLGRVKF